MMNIGGKNVRLVAGFLMLMLLMVGCGQHANDATVSKRTGSALKPKVEETTEEDVPIIAAASEDIYIIEELNMANETITLYSVEDGRQIRYSYNLTTRFLDKFGGSSSWANFTTGTVVNIGEKMPVSGAISEIKKADNVWSLENVDNFKIDKDHGIITVGDTKYRITDKTKVYSDDSRVLIKNITDSDTINIVGIDKQVVSISVTTGHGYLQITNTDLFDNSLIFVGNKIATMIYGDMKLEIPEGTYQITVANDGWGGTGEYTVNRNEVTEVNLNDLKGEGPSYCDVTFIVTVPDTYVYLDGKLIDTDEVAKVRYGSHDLVVNCNGYSSWNKTLVVNSKSATITLALEEEESTASTGGTGQTSTENNLTSNNNSTGENNSTGTTNQGQTGGTNTTPGQNTNSNTSTNSNSNSASEYDYEADYLSTISDLLQSIMD